MREFDKFAQYLNGGKGKAKDKEPNETKGERIKPLSDNITDLKGIKDLHKIVNKRIEECREIAQKVEDGTATEYEKGFYDGSEVAKELSVIREALMQITKRNVR